jgi:tRNA threonylcarbamoyladenosine biosynthesis protein TsaB
MGGSVWLGRGKLELASVVGDPQISQSNSLLADIEQCLKEAGVSLPEIDVFACASGPGSFTGLRIGIATLKGIAATLNRSCVGIPTLDAVALAAGTSTATVALLQAGRGEVFAQLFSVTHQDDRVNVVPLDTPGHLSPQKLIEKYGSVTSLIWAGPGAHAQREVIQQAALDRGLKFSSDFSNSDSEGWKLAAEDKQLARQVAVLAEQAFINGATQLPSGLNAIYVRPSDAELKVQHQ